MPEFLQGLFLKEYHKGKIFREMSAFAFRLFSEWNYG